MRVLHVIRTLNPAWGGPVEVVRNLVAAGATRNIDSEIVCVDHSAADWLNLWPVPVTAVGEGIDGSFYGYNRKLDDWLDGNVVRFDAVIVHGIWMYFSIAVQKAATRHDVPYYVYIHGALDPWFKKQYPLKHIKKTIYWRLFEHKVLRDAASVLFTTEEEKVLAQQAFKPYVCKTDVVGCGIEVPAEALGSGNKDYTIGELTAQYPELKQRRYFLYLGRIHEKKGMDLLLEAFAKVKRLYPDIALVMAGPGDKGFVNTLRDLSERLRIGEDIVWTGPIYGKTKWQALQAAEAFVLISHQENFGISVAEALSSGTPVLISNKVNTWREIDGEGAGLVDSDDTEGAVRLFERWHALSEDERDVMKGRAQSCFKTHFDIARSCDRLFSLISMHNAQSEREGQATLSTRG